MEEKKLTDEEIIRDLKYAIEVGGDADTPPKEIIAFIERLQAENQKQYEDYCLLEVENLNLRQENENLRIDNDDLRERNEKFYELGLNENTARFEDMKKIEWLEDEVQRLAKVEMDLIGKIAEQKYEIERLTEERDVYLDDCSAVRHKIRQEIEEKAELQKQVDELKELSDGYFKKAYFYYQKCKAYGIENFYDDELEPKHAKEGKTITFPKFEHIEVE